MWREFKSFAFGGSVVELAVGVMIGAAFNTLVQAVVNDVLSPLVGLVAGDRDLSDVVVRVSGAEFALGDLANAFIYFVLIAAVLFAVVKVSTVARRRSRLETARTTRPCPWCLEPVDTAARRCRHCAADLELQPSAR